MRTPDGFHRIVSLEVDEGFIGSSHFQFSPDLNCIIGGRGTGKTTVLEFLRYGLNWLPDDAESQEQSDDLSRLLSGNLGNGRVAIEIETKDAMRYRVERSLDEDLVIFDQDGNPVSFTLPGPLFSAEVYSQNEIEGIAKSPRFQLSLLDKFIWAENQDIERQIDETITQLGMSSDRIQSTLRELDELRDQLGELPDVEEKLKAIERSDDGEEHDELHAEHGAKTLRDQQEEKVVEIGERLADLRAELETVADSVRQYTQSLDTSDLASGANQKLMTQLGLLSRRTLDGVIERIVAVCEDLGKGRSQIEDLSGKLRQDHMVQERLYREVLERFEQEKGKARERALLLKHQADLQKLATRQAKAQGELKRYRQEREKLVNKLVELRDQRYRARVGVANDLNGRLSPMIQVRVEQYGNTDAYKELLTELMRNSGLHYRHLVEKTVACVAPEDLAAMVRQDDAAMLADRLDIDRERAQKFLAQLRDHRNLHRVETVELHDRPTIELKDGEEYKDSASLSTGQKCTAILPILLLESEAPLLIDQPEDNLDNAFVFDTVVQSILRVKSSRQLILVTHNPNIPVLGEAERIFVMASTGKQARVAAVGTVDEVRADIERLLEGGRDAFKRRMERYGYRETTGPTV